MLYQMDKIYDGAKYILAVPDMHKGSIYDALPTNPASMRSIFEYRKTIYHLLLGNTQALLLEEDEEEENNNDESTSVAYHRQQAISDAMDFLLNLVTEWSGRVLVISEFFMARKNNNLRFWFSLLEDAGISDAVVSFFKYDFNCPCSTSLVFQPSSMNPATLQCYKDKYYLFYTALAYQLRPRSFLEMMLNSDTKKNEDRFKAILPISEYRSRLTDQAIVDQWRITDMISVKLKLYEIMNTKDKWKLLFMSCHPSHASRCQHIGELPTFATTTPHFSSDDVPLLQGEDVSICNFDWTSPTSIVLSAIQSKDHRFPHQLVHKLTIEPKEYYLHHHPTSATEEEEDLCVFSCSWSSPPPLPLLQQDGHLDVVCIPFVCDPAMKRTNVTKSVSVSSSYWYTRQLFLVGHFEKNKWILTYMPCPKNIAVSPHWTHHKSNAGFDVY